MQLYFTAGIYWLHGKLAAVWNFTSVKLTEVKFAPKKSFTSPELMWTLIMKLPYIEVKFYPDVKSQTDLNSLRVSCKRALRCFTQVQFKSFSHWENTSWKFFKVNNQDIRVTCWTSFYDCIPYVAPFPLLFWLWTSILAGKRFIVIWVDKIIECKGGEIILHSTSF